MHSKTLPQEPITAGGENLQDARKRHRVEVVCWCVGFILFVIICIIIHGHPQPYPFDLATTEIVQRLHIAPWIQAILVFPSVFNNPAPSLIALGLWLVGLLLMGLIFRLQGKSSLVWVQAAISFVLAVLLTIGLQGIAEELVARPRPNPHVYPIHVYTPLVPFPTFPSGHTSHDVVYYGFLLYLSLTKSVREWRYRWILLPFQLFAVFDILAIGYSRILEGDHWLTDVLGGYLEGMLYLFLFIFLYRWTTNILARRRAKRLATNERGKPSHAS